jgi:hypothetical protein
VSGYGLETLRQGGPKGVAEPRNVAGRRAGALEDAVHRGEVARGFVRRERADRAVRVEEELEAARRREAEPRREVIDDVEGRDLPERDAARAHRLGGFVGEDGGGEEGNGGAVSPRGRS